MVHRSELLHAPHFGRHYRRLNPTSALAPYVSCYWQLEGYAAIPQGVAEHLLPRLDARLIFPFANRCLYQLQDQRLQQPSGPHLLGPQAGTLACLHPASQGLLGISFRPGGYQALFPDSGPDSAQALIELPALADFEASLAGQAFEAQAARLETWLLARLSDAPSSLPLLNSALRHLAAGHSVAEAAEALGLAPRSLQRHCQSLLGLSPRTCQRVLRLRATLARLWSEPGYSVWDSPYYDYAHFFREFRSLTGTNPTTYLQRFI